MSISSWEVNQLQVLKTRHLHKMLTYGELDEDVKHLWSVLYLTGYLTLDWKAEDTEDELTRLVIPNREIREIFVEKIRKWFSETVKPAAYNWLCEPIWERDAEGALAQIREKKYAWPYERRKYQVIRYGISYSEKDCCVRTDE